MDCRRRERYQAPILTAAGVSPSEIDQRLRGRTHFLRPPWNAYSSGIDLHRIGGAPSCRGVSAASRRGNRHYADPRLSPCRSGGIASALDAARPDRRRNGLDNAHLARRAWHAVSGVQTRSNDARVVFHAGAANVCTGPDVVSGARSVAWSRCRTYPRNTNRGNRDNSIYCQPLHSCVSGNGTRLSARIWFQIVLDHCGMRSRRRCHSPHCGWEIYRGTERRH